MNKLNLSKKEIGLYIGRFQPLTKGHQLVINNALNECETLIIAIGSTQESLTLRNPFSASIRALLISKVFEKEILNRKIVLCFVPDREHPKDDMDWGKYLINEVKRQTGLTPTKIFEGEENARNLRFNEKVKREIIPKNIIPINASKVRSYIKNNDYQSFNEFMPDEINNKEIFNFMKDIICSIKEE